MALTRQTMTDEQRKSVALEYLKALDHGGVTSDGSNVVELFAEDAQVYFPKLGLARGREQIGRLFSDVAGTIKSIEHHYATFNWTCWLTRARVTASTAIVLGAPGCLITARAAGATCSRSAIGRFSVSSSTLIRIMPDAPPAAILGCLRFERMRMLRQLSARVDRSSVAGWRAWRDGTRALAACRKRDRQDERPRQDHHSWSVESIGPYVLETIDAFGRERSTFVSNSRGPPGIHKCRLSGFHSRRQFCRDKTPACLGNPVTHSSLDHYNRFAGQGGNKIWPNTTGVTKLVAALLRTQRTKTRIIRHRQWRRAPTSRCARIAPARGSSKTGKPVQPATALAG
jgi:hypothetical protein